MKNLKLKFFLAKGPDVPTYVEYGAADIGVVGKDTIVEEGRNALRGAGSWDLENAECVSADRKRPKSCCSTDETDPRGNQIPEYCKRLFL